VHPILVDLVAPASKQADLTDTGLPGGSADTILCVDAFHFASSITAAADERARLLRPGGKLVITTWEPAGADPPHGHQARSDPNAWSTSK
jgi:SAM-dependent methyltransferase